MSITTFTMKTHAVTNITAGHDVNNCIKHGCKPKLLHIVAGKRREDFYVAECKDDACSRMSIVDGADIASIWNKWNPKQEQ